MGPVLLLCDLCKKYEINYMFDIRIYSKVIQTSSYSV